MKLAIIFIIAAQLFWKRGDEIRVTPPGNAVAKGWVLCEPFPVMATVTNITPATTEHKAFAAASALMTAEGLSITSEVFTVVGTLSARMDVKRTGPGKNQDDLNVAQGTVNKLNAYLKFLTTDANGIVIPPPKLTNIVTVTTTNWVLQ